MATRLYLPSDGTPPSGYTPTPDATWESVSLQVGHPVPTATSKINSALAVSSSALTNGANQEYLRYQWISDTLNTNQDISGNISAVVRTAETNTNANAYLALVVRVIGPAPGYAVRGTLYSNSNLGVEFPTVGSDATRIRSAVAMTNVAALAGDRIVIEFGIHGVPSRAGTTGYLTFGDLTNTSDFALTNGLTTNLCPWIELSPTLTFGTPPVIGEYASAGGDATGGGAAGEVRYGSAVSAGGNPTAAGAAAKVAITSRASAGGSSAVGGAAIVTIPNVLEFASEGGAAAVGGAVAFSRTVVGGAVSHAPLFTGDFEILTLPGGQWTSVSGTGLTLDAKETSVTAEGRTVEGDLDEIGRHVVDLATIEDGQAVSAPYDGFYKEGTASLKFTPGSGAASLHKHLADPVYLAEVVYWLECWLYVGAGTPSAAAQILAAWPNDDATLQMAARLETDRTLSLVVADGTRVVAGSTPLPSDRWVKVALSYHANLGENGPSTYVLLLDGAVEAYTWIRDQDIFDGLVRFSYHLRVGAVDADPGVTLHVDGVRYGCPRPEVPGQTGPFHALVFASDCENDTDNPPGAFADLNGHTWDATVKHSGAKSLQITGYEARAVIGFQAFGYDVHPGYFFSNAYPWATQAVTVDGWLRRDVAPSSEKKLLHLGRDQTVKLRFDLRTDGYLACAQDGTVTAHALPLTQWCHLRLTFDLDSGRWWLWIDDALEAVGLGTPTDYLSVVKVGWGGEGQEDPLYTLWLDELRVWSHPNVATGVVSGVAEVSTSEFNYEAWESLGGSSAVGGTADKVRLLQVASLGGATAAGGTALAARVVPVASLGGATTAGGTATESRVEAVAASGGGAAGGTASETRIAGVVSLGGASTLGGAAACVRIAGWLVSGGGTAGGTVTSARVAARGGLWATVWGSSAEQDAGQWAEVTFGSDYAYDGASSVKLVGGAKALSAPLGTPRDALRLRVAVRLSAAPDAQQAVLLGLVAED